MFFFFLSFLAGVLTVLAPCTISLLPVIVGGSMAEGRNFKKVITVTASLALSVIFFTLILKVSSLFVTIPQAFWEIFSGTVIGLIGLSMLFPNIYEGIPILNNLNQESNKLLATGYNKKNFIGDITIGAALGPVFSSCSPTYFIILAVILPKNFVSGLVDLVAYALGLSLALLVVAFAGQKLMHLLGVGSDPKGKFKRIIGILFLIVGIAIATGYDRKLETSLTTNGLFNVANIEQTLLSKHDDTNKTKEINSQISSTEMLTLAEKMKKYTKAPELVSPDGYINTGGQPITLGQYVGKNVVLVDFWDYSCINCQRTFPYLKAWYQKYKDQGLVIVAVHTPEFASEQLQSNVEAAAKQFGLEYPIVLDNGYKTWNAFNNEYWPREYLIDIDGYIVHDHAGEGQYDETEKAIQTALAERASRLGQKATEQSTVNIPEADLSSIGSPETYFGSRRNEYLGNGTKYLNGPQTFTLPDIISPNTLYLGGDWNMSPEYAEAGPKSDIVFRYISKDVYVVARNSKDPVKIKVYRDGKPVGAFAGADVDPATSEATIDGDRLYRLIHDDLPGIHTIKIEIESGVLDMYTFTFG